MKPAPFVYHAPATVEEAVSLLAENEGEARPLAGGQSLIPLMNLRLARPSALVDLNGIAELESVSCNGTATIGALTRHARVCADPEIGAAVPMLQAATRHVGHRAIRERGTLGGSIAHADPSAEAPLVAVALGADLVAASVRGRRSISAAEFFQGPFMTALDDDEILVEAVFPAVASQHGQGFRQVARKHGDFALASVAAVVEVVGDAYGDVRIAVGGVEDRPRRIEEAESALRGVAVGDEQARRRAADIVGSSVSATADAHATAEYRQSVAGALTARALDDATREALGR